MDTHKVLTQIKYTLAQISVSGERNLTMLLGCIQAIDSLLGEDNKNENNNSGE